MKFFTKHRYGIFDVFIITLAVGFAAKNEWLIATTIFVVGAIFAGILEEIYGTK